MRVPKLHESLQGKEFGFDKCLVAPNNLTDFTEDEINMGGHISEHIKLHVPIKSAAMDTVTNAEAAIKLAEVGLIGTLHFNYGQDLQPNIDRQLEEARKVKRYESGVVVSPITLSSEDLIDKAAQIREREKISTIPVTENGELVGVIGKDDYSMLKHQGQPIKNRMIPFEQLVKASWEELERTGKALEIANEMLLDSHKSCLPVIDKDRHLKYLVTRTDLEKQLKFPNGTRDEHKRLRVLAAVESHDIRALPRAEALAQYCDGFVIDTAHGYLKFVYDLTKILKEKYPGKAIIAGNVSFPNAVEYLWEAGADCVRIGNGPGGACQTWDATGTGREQVSAIVDCAYKAHELAKRRPFFINADGGISNSGDIVIALAAGAHTVTLGQILAGTAEAPGDIEKKQGRIVKKYRGMGSAEAMKEGGGYRYNLHGRRRVPEGGVKYVDFKGPLDEYVPDIVQGMRQGMSKAGCKTVDELHEKAMLIYADKTEKREKSKFEG